MTDFHADEPRRDQEGDHSTDHFQAPVAVEMNHQEQRFYDKTRRILRNQIDELREKLGEQKVDYLLLLPDLFVLLVRLARDARVPKRSKLSAGVALAYMLSPLDLIPDVIFGLGWLDDLIVGIYALRRILVDTEQDIVLEHWTGDADLLEKVQEIVEKADNLVGQRVVNALRRLIFRRY